MTMNRKRIFISSVQKEFVQVRRDYILRDVFETYETRWVAERRGTHMGHRSDRDIMGTIRTFPI